MYTENETEIPINKPPTPKKGLGLTSKDWQITVN